MLCHFCSSFKWMFLPIDNMKERGFLFSWIIKPLDTWFKQSLSRNKIYMQMMFSSLKMLCFLLASLYRFGFIVAISKHFLVSNFSFFHKLVQLSLIMFVMHENIPSRIISSDTLALNIVTPQNQNNNKLCTTGDIFMTLRAKRHCEWSGSKHTYADWVLNVKTDRE